jgi:20S proteasome alpha/beta subunit
MTYILGSSCPDGVVLIADRKIIEDDGATVKFEEKLFVDLPIAIIGAAGSTTLSRKFRAEMLGYIEEKKGQLGLQSFSEALEAIVSKLNRGYRDRVQGEIDVLLALKHASGRAILKFIDHYGVSDDVLDYKAIGTGQPFGSVFLKEVWEKGMSMRKVAALGYFIVKYIEEFELDAGVGLGGGQPTILFMPHNGSIYRADSTFLNELDTKTHAMLSTHSKHIYTLFRSWAAD